MTTVPRIRAWIEDGRCLAADDALGRGLPGFELDGAHPRRRRLVGTSGAQAGVAHPSGRDGLRIERADDQGLLELRSARENPPLLIDGEAVAVEHELVLPPDGVAEEDRRQVVARALAQHRLALEPLAGVVGRRGQVDDDLCARKRLGRRRGPRLPDVLADGQPDVYSVELEDRGLAPGREVALLVEHAVVRQVHLPVDRQDLSVREDSRGVVDVVVPLGESDQRGEAARLGCDLVERRAGSVEDGALQQQVLGWIARQGQLGEDDERGFLLPCLAEGLDDSAGVPTDVADDRVDLGERRP
jgi:hypothetical protein